MPSDAAHLPGMIVTPDTALHTAVQTLVVPGVVVGHRAISAGDEDALLPVEAPAFAKSVVKVRRASGAARIVARALLTHLAGRHRRLARA